MAAHTFTLYLSHAVVIGAWQAALPARPGNWTDIALLAAAIVATTVCLQPLTEALQRSLRLRLRLATLAGAMRWAVRPAP
jgi:peptidoglycan/LPS O-acetylase OafA/YrhL